MAELTIGTWDGTHETHGAAMALRDYCGMDIRTARKVIELCKAGGTHDVQVPFARKVLLAATLATWGFPTS